MDGAALPRLHPENVRMTGGNKAFVMETKDVMKQDRRGFLGSTGAAAATPSLGGLPFAAHFQSEVVGKMKIESVGVMSPGDMGQAVALQLKAKGLNVKTALALRSERTRALAREAGLTDVGTITRLVGTPAWASAASATSLGKLVRSLAQVLNVARKPWTVRPA